MDAVTTNEVTESNLHFLDYWRVIRLRRSLILMVFLLCVMTSTLLTIWLPKRYASTAQIEVRKDDPEVAVAEAHPSGYGADPYFLTTEMKTMESSLILTNVIANLRLEERLGEAAGGPRLSAQDTLGALSSMVSVDQRNRMTSLVDITVRGQIPPELCAVIANGVVASYTEFRSNQWHQTKGRGIDALKKDLADTTAELNAAQSNLDVLRSKLNISEINPQSATAEDVESRKLAEWDHQRLLEEADYLEYSNILWHLDQLPGSQLGNALATAYAHQVDPEMTAMAEHLQGAKIKMVEAERNFGTSHETYKVAKQQLEESQQAYENKIDGVMAGIRTRVAHDKGLMEIFQQKEDEITTSQNAVATRNRPYYRAKDIIENLQRIRDEFQRRIIAEVAENGQPNENVVIPLNPATADRTPLWPKSTVIIPLGVAIGLLVGIGLAFFIEYLDTSVKTIDDVERSLQAPVLGVIPQHVGLIVDEGSESPHAEAYRVLRTNLLFSRKNESWNTISVLSGGAGEGKSTTLLNLATVFAQNGQRVLVVDSDLRRPTLHKWLRCANTTGLTDLLLRQRPLEDVILKTKVPMLDFMPTGKLPSSSMNVLGSPQMKEAIQELKRRYDFVFFDAPPLLGVSDASILASEMDMVLQVIQYRRYPQAMTLRAKQMILKVGGNMIGLLLNNINMSQDENYYYYSGYYEYQYKQKNEGLAPVNDANKTASPEIKPKY